MVPVFFALFPNFPKFHAANGIEVASSPSYPKIFHNDSRAHPAGVISSVPARGRRGATTTPDVNHRPFLSAGRASKVDGKARETSLFPKNNSGEPAFPLKSLIRGFVVDVVVSYIVLLEGSCLSFSGNAREGRKTERTPDTLAIAVFRSPFCLFSVCFRNAAREVYFRLKF